MQSMDSGSLGRRLPLDRAPILNMRHVRLLQDSPLVELVVAVEKHRKVVFESEARFQRVVREGLETTTSHLSDDNRQLYAFSRAWDEGRFLPTKRGIRRLLSRTSAMWFEADRYLEISASLKQATLGEGRPGLANEHAAKSLAEFNLDLATKILAGFRDLPSR